MLPVPGLTAMPTVIFNAALNLLRDEGLVVRGPDAVAAVAPMFNEQSGAARAITTLLTQHEPLDELVLSINGGSDRTPLVVRQVLGGLGFQRVDQHPVPEVAAQFERWASRERRTRVVLVDHVKPVSKADSVNLVVELGLVTARRVLVVDGDTEFDPGFVAALKDNFYRLRFGPTGRTADDSRRYGYLLEDVALQSGAVRSRKAPAGQPQAAFIAAGRDAEYALAGLLRAGQCRRVGKGQILGRSRLFTVVGCGFVVRRDAFAMPADTRTEDHDFTLAVQNGPEQETILTGGTLDQRGFRVVVDGKERSFGAYLGRHTPLRVRKSAIARFVPGAAMYTDDPPNLGGFMRQVERWNGGALENALKRLVPAARVGLRPNVLFTLLSAQFENVAGLLLTLALPVLLGLQYALPNGGNGFTDLAMWLGLDLVVTAVLVLSGALRLTATGSSPVRGSRRAALKLTLVGLLPLLVLRSLGAIAYLSAATRVVPAFLRGRRGRSRAGLAPPANAGQARRQNPAPAGSPRPLLPPRPTITWDRPGMRSRPAAHRRAAAVSVSLALVFVLLFSGTTTLTRRNLERRDPAWYHTYAVPRVEKDDHAALPLRLAPGPGPEREADRPDLLSAGFVGPSGGLPAAGLTPAGPVLVAARMAGGENTAAYCSPDDLPSPATVRRTLQPVAGADPLRADEPRRPLSPWGLLILARLAPLLSDLESAATAYDLGADQLLQVVLNESFLDPLAVGPTEDLGLAQVTSDALTLIRSISVDPGSKWHNERLFGGEFNVFDPEFSLCAAAAKLSWAAAQPHGEDPEVAYARYINPLHGAVGGAVAATHVEPVAAMVALGPLVELLAGAVAAYREDPATLSQGERQLLDVANRVERGELDIQGAYDQVSSLVVSLKIDDREFYRTIKRELYGEPTLATASVGQLAQSE